METQQKFKTLQQFFGEENDSLVAIFKWLVYVGSGVTAFLRLEMMLILVILMFLDTIFGTIASWSLGESIKRKKFAIGMLTKIAVFIIPLVVSILGYVYVSIYDSDYSFAWILDATIVILLANESLSFFSNVLTLITGQRVKNVDFVEKLLNFLRNQITGFVDWVFITIDKNSKK